jgi:predicted dehydrogenase
MEEQKFGPISRRTFIQTTAAAAVVALPGSAAPIAARQGSDVLRVGLIGCGGRGTGAARDCMAASPGVQLVAMGDLTADRLARCREQLQKTVASTPAMTGKYNVTDERCFVGFDAYQKVLASDIDLVILATPPGFRPMHLAAAVNAGKHIFTEKPVCTDVAGYRSVLATYELARQKDLSIVAGTQRRHQADYRATIERLHDGAIGNILSGQVYWNQGGLWNHARQPEWTDVEWQIRNWLYFTWLSGDHIVEQHVHNIDVANWVLGEHPIKATGVGGRQVRTEPIYGHIYDHFAIDFEYPSGARVMSQCRQIVGTANNISEHFLGSRGRSNPANEIWGANAWKFEAQGQRINGYVQEHADLVASIRQTGKHYNELKQVAESTLTAIMGREAAYTGQEITWDQLVNAQQDLTPKSALTAFGPLEVPPVAVPGQTKLERPWNG